MRRTHRTMADIDGGRHHHVNMQGVYANHGPNHVDNRIDRPYFMKVDRFQRFPMQARFCIPQTPEDI